MMKNKIILFMLIASFPLYGQINIEECYGAARDNYPLIEKLQLIERTKEYTISTIKNAYLPQIQLSADAAYQSQTIELPMEIPGFEGVMNHQYGASVNISQLVWDGGYTSSQKSISNTQAKTQEASVEVMMYKVKERINSLYFGILLANELIRQTHIYKEEIERSQNRTKASIAAGVATETDLNYVSIEEVKLKQSMSQLENSREGYIKMLSLITGLEINNPESLAKPKQESTISFENLRPELMLYSAQIANFEAERKKISASLMPKISVFANGGYGMPGLNMLGREMSPYFTAGLSFKWNFGEYYNKASRLAIISSNQKQIEADIQTFLLNSSLNIENEDSKLKHIRETIESDENLIKLRKTIKQSAEAQVEEGTMSIMDYMTIVSQEQLAINEKILHEIELLQAIFKIKYETNN